MKTRTPNAGDLARAYAELMARNRLKQTHYAPSFKVVRENVRARVIGIAMGYKQPEPWRANPFVRKMGALDD
jgi:hypothetical protein